MFGQVFFSAFLVFPVVYAIGYCFEKAVMNRDLGMVGNTLKHILFFVGVIVHEVSHRLMCLLAGIPAHNTRVHYRDKYGQTNPGGAVTLRQPFQLTFFQGFLVCFGPLIIGAWILYYLLLVAFNPFFDPVIRVISGFCCVSILLAISPSQGDLFHVKFSFQNDPSHGLYQIFLAGLSFLIVWALVGVYNILFPVEFLYYFLIIGTYIILKYTFILIRILLNKIRFRKGTPHSAAGYRRLARKRYKPRNPYGGRS
jgi:hypothetical protein